jgi:quinolinate synthase
MMNAGASTEASLADEIRALKTERRARIVAHNYQIGPIQDLADYVGDSLGMTLYAQQTDAALILVCGVHFMAETAAILCPDKTVLVPDLRAGCSLAAMIGPESIRRWRQDFPAGKVVCYVNSSAEVKAESDVCCTSTNAVRIVESFPPETDILMVPDQFLGMWVRQATNRKVHLWGGYCHAHHKIRDERIRALKREHPDAKFLMHPECGCLTASMPLADKVLSTGGILKHARESPAREFIIGTEVGILHRLRKENPGKTFYPAAEESFCEFMKLNDLEKVRDSLENLEFRVTVPEEIARRARGAIERMVQLSKAD